MSNEGVFCFRFRRREIAHKNLHKSIIAYGGHGEGTDANFTMFVSLRVDLRNVLSY